MDFRSALFGAIAAVVAICMCVAVYFALGFYNIGADAPHLGVTRAVIGYVRNRSIATRAGGITVPSLNEPGHVADGAADYDAMCTSCHLAPGMP